MWLTGRAAQLRPPDQPLLPAPADVDFIPHDSGLPERARMQWMTGDWQALAALDSATLESHPERARLAAYVGAGLQQLGQHAEAKRRLEQAREWGCARTLLTEVLLSGVYYTLARAALVAGDRARALRNLQQSIEVGMPGHDVGSIARARIGTQGQMPGANVLDWGVMDQLQSDRDWSGDSVFTAHSPDCDPSRP